MNPTNLRTLGRVRTFFLTVMLLVLVLHFGNLWGLLASGRRATLLYSRTSDDWPGRLHTRWHVRHQCSNYNWPRAVFHSTWTSASVEGRCSGLIQLVWLSCSRRRSSASATHVSLHVPSTFAFLFRRRPPLRTLGRVSEVVHIIHYQPNAVPFLDGLLLVDRRTFEPDFVDPFVGPYQPSEPGIRFLPLKIPQYHLLLHSCKPCITA